MKKGDLIIWDSGSGYEVGMYLKDIGVMYGTCEVILFTGASEGKISFHKREIFPFLAETIDRLNSKYGYGYLVSRRYDSLLERLNIKKLQYENSK